MERKGQWVKRVLASSGGAGMAGATQTPRLLLYPPADEHPNPFKSPKPPRLGLRNMGTWSLEHGPPVGSVSGVHVPCDSRSLDQVPRRPVGATGPQEGRAVFLRIPRSRGFGSLGFFITWSLPEDSHQRSIYAGVMR